LKKDGVAISQKKAKKKISKYFNGKTYEEIAKTEKGKTRRQRQSKWRIGLTHEQIMGKEKALKFKEVMSGSGNPSWRGGTSKRPNKGYRGENWKVITKDILERDNYKCQHCNKEVIGHGASIHHIIPLIIFIVKHNFNIEDALKEANEYHNLVTVCRSCHQVEERKWDIIIKEKYFGQYRAKPSEKKERVETIYPTPLFSG